MSFNRIAYAVMLLYGKMVTHPHMATVEYARAGGALQVLRR